MARVEPRLAPFKKELRALSRLTLTPPRPCLNLFPRHSSTIASLSGRSASHHDLQTSDAARRFATPKDAAIFATTSYGSAEKSRPSDEEEEEDEEEWSLLLRCFLARSASFTPLMLCGGRAEKREPSDRLGQVHCFIFCLWPVSNGTERNGLWKNVSIYFFFCWSVRFSPNLGGRPGLV